MDRLEGTRARGVTRYALGVAAVGVGMALLLSLLTPLVIPGSLVSMVTLATLATASSWFPVRFRRRGNVQGFTTEEAVFIALLFALPSGAPPLVMVAAALLGYAVRLRDPIKVAFNVGQIGVWASVATVVFHAVGPGESVLAPRSLLAAGAAMLTLNVISLVMMAELFRRISGRAYRDTVSEVLWLNVVTAAGNSALGLLLGFTALVDPRATLVAAVMIVISSLGYRGYASAMEERRRNGLLDRVSLTLADVGGTDSSVETFLRALSQLFSAGTVELALAGDDGFRYVRYDGDEPIWDVTPSPALAEALGVGKRVDVVGDGAAAASGAHDTLTAPMIHHGRLIGALTVTDRSGFEPSRESDATLLGTLANEAAAVLKNVELFAAIERERGRLAAESGKLSEVVNAASDGIAMIESDGRISVWNAAMERSTGIDAGTAIGLPWDLAFRAKGVDGRDIASDSESVIHRILRGEAPATAVDLQVLRRDGDLRWLRCSVSPTARPEAHDGAVIVARDVTHEREVAQLKGDFVATVSHELRTPLTPLRGFYETLRGRRDELSPEHMDVILRSMGSQLDRLERTVGDLLFVADAHHGVLHFNPEPVVLQEAVGAEITATLGLDERSRVETEGDDAVVALADRAAVARVARALVSNALKHTTGEVRITFLQEGDYAVLEVSDDGPGIAPWDQERIFERFTRLGDHLHRVQGSGLGLPIARSLAAALDGDITVQSDLGAGATFRLSLPLAHPGRPVGPRAEDVGDANGWTGLRRASG